MVGTLVALSALVTGCTATLPAPTPTATPVTASPADAPPWPTPTHYRGGRLALSQVPAEPRAVVLLVPGGGWETTDPGDVGRLADFLSARGIAAVRIDYGTSSTGATWPEPAQDVACAVAYAASLAPDVPLVAVGHSAGAHLALLVGLRPDQGGDCAHPPAEVDGVVGLAGPYDVVDASTQARHLFGAGREQVRDAWVAGNPMTWVEERPALPVLLVHGEDDTVVPLRASLRTQETLAAAGHEVRSVVLPGVDHDGLLVPDVVGADLLAFVDEVVASHG